MPERDYRIAPVFGNMTPQLRGELVQFWLDEGALPDANTAWARTDEVVCIARDADDAIASVNTVHLAPLQGAEDLHYFYRMFTRPHDRLWQLSAGMLRACVEAITKTPRRDPRARGLAIVAENPKLQTPAGRRVLTSMGWRYLGKTARELDVWTIAFPETGAETETR